MKKGFLFAFLFTWSCLTFSWNMVGHRVVAQIAYDNMTREAKRKFNALNHALDNEYSPKSFVNAASWMDEIKYRDIKIYDPWHYIDIPFSPDGTPLPDVPKVNAVWALDQAALILMSDKTSDYEKGFFLRVFIHVLGDIHQPLHTVVRVTEKHPDGDRGGNLFSLGMNKVADNLHSYWDRGAGLFNVKNTRYTNKKIKQIAARLEKKFPLASVDLTFNGFDIWVREANLLAKEVVYAIGEGEKPSSAYQRKARRAVEKQVALAGYRLAALLNGMPN